MNNVQKGYNEFDGGMSDTDFEKSGKNLRSKAEKAGLQDYERMLQAEGLGEIETIYGTKEKEKKVERNPFKDGF